MKEDFQRILELIGATNGDEWGIKIDPARSLYGMSELLQLFDYFGIFSNGRVGQFLEITFVYGDFDDHKYAFVTTIISFLTAILKGRDARPFWVYGYKGENGILIKVVGEIFTSAVGSDFCRHTTVYNSVIGKDRMMFYHPS